MSHHDVFIARQPILDRNEQLYAYELLFRARAAGHAEVSSDLAATAAVLDYVFAELGLEATLGPHLGFVNLDARMLMSDALEMLPREKFVLEVLETVEITPEVVERCRALKDLGFRLALDDFVRFEERHRPLLDLADIVKIDLLQLEPAALDRTVAQLKAWPVRLLAEKVDSEEQSRRCLDLGFDLFQGYYFARPALVSGKRLDRSAFAVLRLLGLIEQGADTSTIEQVFKQEPGLTLNLLRLANCAAAGMRSRVGSLAQAIMVLGHDQLKRWLSLLMFSGEPGSRIPSPLMRLAATRARFMENLSARLDGSATREHGRAFMTGVLSLIPALLRIPIADLLAQLNLSDDLRQALEQRTGRLGSLLWLAEALEADDPRWLDAAVRRFPGIDADIVNAAAGEAQIWANDIGKPAPA